MLKKIKHGFAIFFSFLWITEIALVCYGDYSQVRGLEMNGIICFIMWLVFIYIMLKKSILVADIGFIILYLILLQIRFGLDQQLIIGLATAGCIAGGTFLFLKKVNLRRK